MSASDTPADDQQNTSTDADDSLREAILHGASLRVRPVMMTAMATIGGLLPVMLGAGTGSEIMTRIAAPMVGGMLTAVLLTLYVIPLCYYLLEKYRAARRPGADAGN